MYSLIPLPLLFSSLLFSELLFSLNLLLLLLLLSLPYSNPSALCLLFHSWIKTRIGKGGKRRKEEERKEEEEERERRRKIEKYSKEENKIG
jgi:hypothetical protein